MSSHSRVAARVRAEKEAHPENFCRVKSCLWRIKSVNGDSPCRKHPLPPAKPELPAVKCGCPYLLTSIARHLPSCQRYEDPATVADIADDDPRLEADEMPEFEPEYVEYVSGDPLPDNPWYVAGVYYGNAYDASIARRELAAKAKRQGERIAAVIARMAGAEAAD